MKWWEKTVEYFFIQKYVGDLFIAPLDGKAELAGDALLSNNQRWVIIEFKDRVSSLDSEINKFKSYSEAAKELGNQDKHHCLIYGMINNEGEFKLGGQTYFSRTSIGSIKNFLNSGLDEDKFLDYLRKLIHYKSEKGTSANGNIGSYSLVAGINKNNQIVSCLTLNEYGLEHDLTFEASPKYEKQKEIERNRDRGFDGPSF